MSQGGWRGVFGLPDFGAAAVRGVRRCRRLTGGSRARVTKPSSWAWKRFSRRGRRGRKEMATVSGVVEVTVRYWAAARDAAGVAEESLVAETLAAVITTAVDRNGKRIAEGRWLW